MNKFNCVNLEMTSYISLPMNISHYEVVFHFFSYFHDVMVTIQYMENNCITPYHHRK